MVYTFGISEWIMTSSREIHCLAIAWARFPWSFWPSRRAKRRKSWTGRNFARNIARWRPTLIILLRQSTKGKRHLKACRHVITLRGIELIFRIMRNGIPSGKSEADVLNEVRKEAHSLRGKSSSEENTEDVEDPLNSSINSVTTGSALSSSSSSS